LTAPAQRYGTFAGIANSVRTFMFRIHLGVALAALACADIAAAQSYPTRPITFIVPYGPGGPADTMGRTMAEAMRPHLGQSVVIENVTGANGTIGVGRMVRATPDGYTVGVGNWPSMITNGAIYKLSYDIQKDLEPVARLPHNPYIAVVRKDFPAKDFKEMIAWLKANPDKATEGTAGVGSGQHVSGVYFQKVTGTKFRFVPYKAGSSDIIRDMVAGHIDFTFDQAITSLTHIKGGNVKGYAVTSNRRLEAAPDIPTMDEAGVPGVYISTWYGLWAPKGTPKEAIDKLGEAARKAMADPAVRAKLAALGQQIPTPEEQTAPALAAFTKAEIDKWHALIKEAGIALN